MKPVARSARVAVDKELRNRHASGSVVTALSEPGNNHLHGVVRELGCFVEEYGDVFRAENFFHTFGVVETADDNFRAVVKPQDEFRFIESENGSQHGTVLRRTEEILFQRIRPERTFCMRP